MPILKLTNGGSIQVRTGVLAGVGPTGPTGPIGQQGPQGDVGPQGEVGPQGQILEQMSKATVTSNTALSATTLTNVAFQTAAFDDLSCFASTVNLQLRTVTDYLLSVWVEFAQPAGTASGVRQLSFVSTTNGILAKTQVGAVVGDSTFVNLVFPCRSTIANEIVNVKAYSTNACNITTGVVALNRVGSGPVGPTGPQGAQGIQGNTGATGPKGDDGDANSGFTTYAELL